MLEHVGEIEGVFDSILECQYDFVDVADDNNQDEDGTQQAVERKHYGCAQSFGAGYLRENIGKATGCGHKQDHEQNHKPYLHFKVFKLEHYEENASNKNWHHPEQDVPNQVR